MIDGVDKTAIYVVCGVFGYILGSFLREIIEKRRNRGKNRHDLDPS